MSVSRMLSVIVPCYNEEDNLAFFYEKTSSVIARLRESQSISEYEFLFVDDGSTDATLAQLKKLAKQDSRVYYLSFTRNFGKEAAILAGLAHSRGDYVTLMDADLQDPPELLLEMFAMMDAAPGIECVAALRKNRDGEPVVRSFFASVFYKLINLMSHVEIKEGVRDFRLMTRRVVNSVLALKEKGRFSKGLFVWAGYRTCYVEYHNVERSRGASKWSFWKLFHYSLDGITAFSVIPLQLSALLGCFCCLGAVFAILFFVIQKLTVGIPIQGYAMLVCSIFLLGGVQLLSLGILGQYLGKVFIESKGRPDYVVLESNILGEGD